MGRCYEPGVHIWNHRFHGLLRFPNELGEFSCFSPFSHLGKWADEENFHQETAIIILANWKAEEGLPSREHEKDR